MSNPKSDEVNKTPYVNRRKKNIIIDVKKPRKPTLQAPYNFVRLDHRIFEAYKSPEDLPDPRKISNDLITGEISYSVLSKSPIVFEHGSASLTASMMRGLIRSNLQILSFSSVDRDVEDVTFKYRDFFDNYYNKVLGEHIVTKKSGNVTMSYPEYSNIHAGIMYKDKDVWYIKPSSAFNGKGFKILNLQDMQDKYKNWRKRFKVSYEGNKNVFEILPSKHVDKTARSQKAVHDPFYKMVSFEYGENGNIKSIGEAGIYENSAYLINTGSIYGSVSMYLIPCGSTNLKGDAFQVPYEDISNYTKYLRKQRNISENSYNGFYEINEEGERPVFYIKGDRHFDFGFTYVFPINFRHSVKYGIPNSHKDDKIDYNRAVFGFYGLKSQDSDRRFNYGGRVVFLEPYKDKDSSGYEADILLPNPKPSSNIFYTYNDNSDRYNSDSFSINGIKQFRMRYGVSRLENDLEPSSNARVKGDGTGTQYQGKILFYNLREDELGLLIWSIRLNNGCFQNIGAGKQYGYGRVVINVTDVKQYWHKPALTCEDLMLLPESRSLDQDYYIKIYCDRLNAFLYEGLEENRTLRDFFTLKSSMSFSKAEDPVYDNRRNYYSEGKFKLPSVAQLYGTWVKLVIPGFDKGNIEGYTWDKFIQSPPPEMTNMASQMLIYNAYKELVVIAELYKNNRRFYIREELLKEYKWICDRIAELLNREEEKNDLEIGNASIEEHINRCIDEIYLLISIMKDYEKEFRNESVPVLESTVTRTVVNTGEKKLYLTIQLALPESSATIRINHFQVTDRRDKQYSQDLKTFIAGGEKDERAVVIRVDDDDIDRSYVELKIRVEYQYRAENSQKTAEYDNQIEIPFIKERFRLFENPYSSWLGNEVSDRNMFFGRDEMLKEIRSKIESCSGDHPSGRNIIIYGQKRTGKSTLLHFLKEDLRKTKPNNYVVVDIGNVGSVLQINSENGITGTVNLRLFFRKMIDVTEAALESDHVDLLEDLLEEGFEFPKLEECTYAEAMQICESFFKKLTDRLMPGKRVVILIDEFTYFYDLIEKGYVDEYFMQFWKAFIQNSRVCVVLSGQDFMDDFRNRFANEFGASDVMRISYLDREAAIDLIRKPFNDKNGYDGFSDECVERILNLTACSAFYTMYICSGLVDYLNEKKQWKFVTPSVMERFLQDHWMNPDSAKRIDRSFFESLYRDGTHPEWDDDNLRIMCEVGKLDGGSGAGKEEVVHSLTNNNSSGRRTISFCRDKIQRLIYRDVINEKNGKIRIRVGLLQRWLEDIY